MRPATTDRCDLHALPGPLRLESERPSRRDDARICGGVARPRGSAGSAGAAGLRIARPGNARPTHHGFRCRCGSSRAWGQAQARRPEGAPRLKNICAPRVRLQVEHQARALALFNPGIESRLRGCDLVALEVRDLCRGGRPATRAVVMQHETRRPVQFKVTQTTLDALQAWIEHAEPKPEDFPCPSRLHESPHLGTRRHATGVAARPAAVGQLLSGVGPDSPSRPGAVVREGVTRTGVRREGRADRHGDPVCRAAPGMAGCS